MPSSLARDSAASPQKTIGAPRMRRPDRDLRLFRDYFVAMIAPRVVVKSVFDVLFSVAKMGAPETSMRLSSMSVRWLATTYESVSVPDSVLLDPSAVVPAMTRPWLSPKYSPRSAMANGSATTYLMPRFTPYQDSDSVLPR